MHQRLQLLMRDMISGGQKPETPVVIRNPIEKRSDFGLVCLRDGADVDIDTGARGERQDVNRHGR